ncbi:pyruvate kinase [Acaryochloris marina NIES-2412]|uniref:pyruvate kinase n=1 Tax=Acaryochloris marina TaxID=155978 RepID=UPI004057F3DD
MASLTHRTKIVATIGPASSSPDIIRQMVRAGMDVARLNFSHGTYEQHAQMVKLLRSVSAELDTPVTLLQDLQGPKIRVGQIADGAMKLVPGERLTLVAEEHFHNQPRTVAIDYPYLAKEAQSGTPILMDDGLLELRVEQVEEDQIHCQIIQGGILGSRKGVNLPTLDLQLPSLTDKDRQDLEFGLSQGVDWVSLSFVRRAADIHLLKEVLAGHGAADVPVMAKIEKPHAIANLEAILDASDAVMVARGDLGVEMRAEKVPKLQKQIIRACNKRKLPVVTATQMLDSMIRNPRPTRAEASDVANAIIDGTDAVMLSGESAVGQYPVKAVEMLARIATDVEPDLNFVNNPPACFDETHALSEALSAIQEVLSLKCIAAFTSTGYTALMATGERPRTPVIAITPFEKVYHRLNLVWGVKPILIDHQVESFEHLVSQAQTCLLEKNLVKSGDKILIIGGIPTQQPRGTNFIKIHQIE